MDKRIKLIIFDLDGVLVDTKDIHYKALNDALHDSYKITPEEHVAKYDGLPTVKKFEMLTSEKGMPKSIYDSVFAKKQAFTQKNIDDLIVPDDRIIGLLEKLHGDGYIIHCASNAIKETVWSLLAKSGIIEFFDEVLSNEDVVRPKPHPEMFMQCMIHAGVGPKETLIIEDSPRGIEAARSSGANVLVVKNKQDLTVEKTYNCLEGKRVSEINVIIPMAGEGSRFKEAGYSFIKPLIDINGKPMIQVVVESLGIKANYIFIVQKKHCEKYDIKYLLQLISADCEIVEIDGVTEGAACTTLLAKDYIDDKPLIIANADQYIEWSSTDFFYKMIETRADGGILTFRSVHPKWSFVRMDGDNVVEVAEKRPISDIATVGIYWWSSGMDYIKYAEQMILKGIRTKGEFYVAPVFNEAIADGKKIKIFDVDVMKGLGTPEDVKTFLRK